MQFRLFFLVLNVIAIQAIKQQRSLASRQVKADPAKVASCVEDLQSYKGGKRYNTTIASILCSRVVKSQTAAKETKKKGGFHKPKLTAKQQGYFDNLERKAKNRRGKRQTSPPVQRMEIRCMPEEQRKKFYDCVKALKATLIDGTSQYDLFRQYHNPPVSPGAHGGDSFCTWHRYYLYLFELACQEHVPEAALPYWDSSLDQLLIVTSDSIIWSELFLGTPIGPVTSGPFANMEAPTDPTCVVPNRLCRDVSYGNYFLYDDSIFDFVETRTSYGDLSACRNPRFEADHGGIHVCVAGQMDELATAPADPCFYLHHGFVDYLFELFRQTVQTREERETDVPPICSCSEQCGPDDDMLPFYGTLNKHGLNNSYTDYYYTYQKHPQCNAALTACDPPSEFLFCDKESRRCVSKVKPGGDCTGFANTPICYQGTCTANRCVDTTAVVPVS